MKFGKKFDGNFKLSSKFLKILGSKIVILVSLVMVLSLANVFAMEPVIVRVVNGSFSSRTYTFSCLENPQGSGLVGNSIRKWTVYRENPEVYELKDFDLPANQNFSYTFNFSGYYNVECLVPNPPGLNYQSFYRHDVHLDMRTQLDNISVIPLSVGPGQITENCAVQNNGTPFTLSWDLTTYAFAGGGKTVRYPLNVTSPFLTFVPPVTPGLFDTHCIVHYPGTDKDIAWAVDFPTVNATPYVADHSGIDLGNSYIPFNYNTWIQLHNGTNSTPAPIQNGGINVTTNPSQVDLFLNSAFQGTSDINGQFSIQNVVSGSYTLIGSKSGYLNNSAVFTVNSGANTTVNILLSVISQAPQNASIALLTTPSFASVFLNNALQGISDFFGSFLISNLTPGTYNLQVSKANFTTNTTTVSLGSGQNLSVSVTLQPSNVSAPQSNQTCFSSVALIPANCTGGTIISDSVNGGGGRVITCSNGTGNLSILAHDKPDTPPKTFFEMYNTAFNGPAPIQICIGPTCILDSGFASSPTYPMCVGSQNSPSNNTQPSVQNGSINITTNPAFSSVSINGNPLGASDGNGNIYIPNLVQGSYNIIVSKSNFIQNSTTVNLAQGQNLSLSISLSSAPPQNNQNGGLIVNSNTPSANVSLNSVLFGITDGQGKLFGQIDSGNYNINIAAANFNPFNANIAINQGQNTTVSASLSPSGPGNVPPFPPTWIEPSNVTLVNSYDFHVNVMPMTDFEGDPFQATDFEMWDVQTNQRVWSDLNSNSFHVHKCDGKFEDGLFNASWVGQPNCSNGHLAFDHDYKIRSRFYEKVSNVTQVSDWSQWRLFHTQPPVNLTPGPTSWSTRPGYSVQLVATNISLPVNVGIAPSLYNSLPFAQRPHLYVTQLYGTIGVIKNDGSYSQYASNLLNFNPVVGIPGNGETGVDGLYVDQNTGDLFVSMVYASNSSLSGLFGKVVHFKTNANGDSFTSMTTVISGIQVAPSHHIHTVTRGPDGKLYVSVGDAHAIFGDAKNLTINSGKVLRFNDDGTVPSDNPIPGSYVYAAGFRNPFGNAWRPGTNQLFVTNNGPDNDDGIFVVRPDKPVDTFGWCCDTFLGTWYDWHYVVAPVQDVFDTGISGFPQESAGSLYVALSGSTYAPGPSVLSKRIVQFNIRPDGTLANTSDLVTYTGSGHGDPIGLAFGNDGLYFTDIYGDVGFVGAGVTKGSIYKVVFGDNQTNQTPVNQTPQNTTFSAGLTPAPWYPKGLDVVWICNAVGGSGSFSYDFLFGDGNQYLNYNQNNVYHTYPANGTYAVSCTVHDLSNSATTLASTTLVLGPGNSSGSQTGSISVTTAPTQANVFLNNVSQGTSDGSGNLVISNLAAGNYNLVVSKTNFTSNTTQVALAQGQSLSISITLSPSSVVCYSSVQKIPATCSAGSLTDTFNGCRTLVCQGKQVLACDKSGFFEMYNQGGPNSVQICIGQTCILDGGYAKSPNYPICI